MEGRQPDGEVRSLECYLGLGNTKGGRHMIQGLGSEPDARIRLSSAVLVFFNMGDVVAHLNSVG